MDATWEYSLLLPAESWTWKVLDPASAETVFERLPNETRGYATGLRAMLTLGAAGWELAASMPDGVLVFKRAVAEPAPASTTVDTLPLAEVAPLAVAELAPAE
jgi:hypothetical protein